MGESQLMCNFPKCKLKVKGEATITGCSHIFCKNHNILCDGPTVRCPACNIELDSSKDAYKTNVNLPDELKSVIMLTLIANLTFT